MIKLFLTIILIFLFISVYSQNNIGEFVELMKNKVIQEYHIDLNNDNISDTIKFKFPANVEHSKFSYSDPGIFNILEISIANGQNLIIERAFDTIPEKILNKFSNKINSNMLLINSLNTEQDLLMLVGPGYGCCLEELFLIKPIQDSLIVINDTEFQITDIGNSNSMKLVGRQYMSEMWGDYFGNYDFVMFRPVKVFDIEDKLVLNEKLTYQYNSDLFNKYGEFLNFKNPVIIKNKKNGKEILDKFENVKILYTRKYPSGSQSRLHKPALIKYSPKELRIMRNEIFASHGYIFSSQDLDSYFKRTVWYNPTSKNVDQYLTDIEKHNIKLISEKEKEIK